MICLNIHEIEPTEDYVQHRMTVKGRQIDEKKARCVFEALRTRYRIFEIIQILFTKNDFEKMVDNGSTEITGPGK